MLGALAVLSMLSLALLAGCGESGQPLAARGQIAHSTEADRARGRRLIAEYGCIACHAVPGVRGPTARLGPPLAQFGQRAYVAGVLPNTPANLVRWLLDPPGISPHTAMPDVGLSKEQARDIAAYLLALD
jgi:cytochrome c2